MIKKILLGLMPLLVALAFAAEDIELNPNHPGRYVVKKGDTLWDISARFLVKPWLWPEIWQVNPQIRNPHLIYPGDVLTLAFRDGRPYLQLGQSRNVKLSPSIRESTHDRAIPAIPLDAIGPFLTRPMVFENEDDLDLAPYVVSSQDRHLVVGSGNRIYIRGLPDDGNTNYAVMRKGQALIDPSQEEVFRDPTKTRFRVSYKGQQGEVLGYDGIHVADAAIERYGDPATGIVLRSEREIKVGDRLFPLTDTEFPEFYPQAPYEQIDGRIISILDTAITQIGQYQIAILNEGANRNLKPGDVLAIYTSGQVVRDQIAPQIAQETGGRIKFQHEDESSVDSLLSNVANDVAANKRAVDKALGVKFNQEGELVELPEERIGELMVFRVFDRVSYALVMRSSRPVYLYDKVRNP